MSVDTKLIFFHYFVVQNIKNKIIDEIILGTKHYSRPT